MKVFQVLQGFCHWDATSVHPTLDSIAPDQYHTNIEFVEAPNYVFEGWGYDETVEKDARFIEPTPPEGWLYDGGTGTFYPDPNYTLVKPNHDLAEAERTFPELKL